MISCRAGYNEVEFRLEGFREGVELSMHHSRAAESAHFTSFRDGATERFEAFVTDILKGHSNWKHGLGWELKTKHKSQHVFPVSGVLGSLLGDGEIQPTGSVPLEMMQTSVPRGELSFLLLLLLHLTLSYYAEGCMVRCMGGHKIRYFPRQVCRAF